MIYAPLAVDVTGWLIGQLEPAGLGRVGSKTPTDLQSEVPFVRVVRVGGPNDGVILDAANVAFHCFATDQQGANTTGYAVIRAVMALRGQSLAGAVLTRAGTLSGPSWAPVDDQNLAHAVVLMQTRIKTTGQ